MLARKPMTSVLFTLGRYVLASKHFGPGVAAAPAASMVWLAAVGAGVAIAWRRLVPLEDVEPS